MTDDITCFQSPVLGDTCYEVKHPSGLTIEVYPKEHYSSSYAIFGTNYGSIDTVLKQKGGAARPIPAGTAHFLEHKLFESKERDAFERFAETGANANAFTSFDRTCFLFSCSDHFAENLGILIDFVQHPYFTEQTVRKEQGIIGQEIMMYRDDPSWAVYFNLLKCLYQNHPVHTDIAGTPESISHITADLLYDCYRNFYDLNNMVLAVAGNTTVEEVLSVADKMLTPTEAAHAERTDFGEPAALAQQRLTEKFPVSMPILALGYKELYDKPIRTLKEKIIADILLDYIAGDTTPLYSRLLDEGLVNAGFGSEFVNGYGYACTVFEGETRDPDALAGEIDREIRRVKAEGLDPEEFDRILKMEYGRAVMDYNDVEGLANAMVSAHFEGYRLFDELEVYRTLTLDEAQEQLAHMMNESERAMSVVLPEEGSEMERNKK